MDQGYNLLGFGVIVILYAAIGYLAASGAIQMGQRLFTPKTEQLVYAVFLIAIAAFYLAFAAFFEVGSTAWRLEKTVVLAFVAMSLLATRFPLALVAGYSLHGIWDLLHEFQAHGVHSAFKPAQLTAIPLAYGVFCAVFDFCMAAYFYKRRVTWIAARKPVSN